MRKHKTSPIPITARDWQVAKTKGRRERMFDRVTGKWGPWTPTPERYQTERILAAATRAGGDVTPAKSTEELHALTVPDLRHLAQYTYRLHLPTRTRKASLVDAIVAAQHGRGM